MLPPDHPWRSNPDWLTLNLERHERMELETNRRHTAALMRGGIAQYLLDYQGRHPAPDYFAPPISVDGARFGVNKTRVAGIERDGSLRHHTDIEIRGWWPGDGWYEYVDYRWTLCRMADGTYAVGYDAYLGAPRLTAEQSLVIDDLADDFATLTFDIN